MVLGVKCISEKQEAMDRLLQKDVPILIQS